MGNLAIGIRGFAKITKNEIIPTFKIVNPKSVWTSRNVCAMLQHPKKGRTVMIALFGLLGAAAGVWMIAVGFGDGADIHIGFGLLTVMLGIVAAGIESAVQQLIRLRGEIAARADGGAGETPEAAAGRKAAS